jgi:two-component system, chemotaxis family, chemotaxis protein CheY
MGRKVKVLIVDDQKSIRNVLASMVGTLGGEVVGEAANGEEGVAQFAALQPDMVLMDITMPKMNGIEALKRIMTINPDALVIMLTSHNTVEIIQECIESGAQNFLLKSNAIDVLCEELKSTWIEYVKTLQGV